MSDYKIGDRIIDAEDGDCYFEGIVISLNPLKYKIDKVVWNDYNIIDDHMLGQIIKPKWYWLDKVN